jgi:predicted transcriptional regulator
MSKVDDSLKDIKYLLGNMGMDIFFAIDNGAKDCETIKIFSGLPMACVKGRLPVLLDLLLVVKNDDGYFLTNKGLNFKAQIENNP